ncbi:MAG: hypothetical protein M0P47_11590 [Bacteroidales bacterium]|nr:hypothetical protein [Bacteroidales bacterium]
MKGIISFSIGLIGLIICFFLVDAEPKATIFKIALGFVVGGIIEFIVYIIENRNRWNILKTLILMRNKPVRVTIAYLFRIEMNGKYILIKRHKKDNPGYQPIGGAYKYLKEENRELFDKLGVEPCHFVPRDEDTEHDLRVIVNKRKNLVKLLRWFESRKNRELDPYREFYEELVEPGFLSKNVFKHIKYIFIGKHLEGVLKSPVYPIDELRYAEIFELRTEDDAQKKEIMNLLKFQDEILFATPDEIRKKASHDGKVILSHSFKILPLC